jgi:hypothetical protein
MHRIVPIPSQTLTYVNRDGGNLESSMIIKDVRSLHRSIFLMHNLELCLESLAFQEIVSLSGNAFLLTNHLLTNLGTDSIYEVAMILYA